MRFKAQLKVWFRVNREALLAVMRRLAIHTSAIGFTSDFIHSWLGEAMIFSTFYERAHERVLSYSALAAAIVPYIDVRLERLRQDREHAKIRQDLVDAAQEPATLATREECPLPHEEA